MAITRIKNNQITDATIVANTKCQALSVTGGLLENNLTYGSDLTVTGNLTVNGTTTTISTANTTVEDPILLLASTQTGAPAADIGFVGERGTADNIAFIWDEAADTFVVGTTASTGGTLDVAIIAEAAFKAGAITGTGAASFASLGTTGALSAGSLTVTGLSSLDGGIDVNNSAFTVGTTGNILTTGTLGAAATTVTTITASGLADLNGDLQVGNQFTVLAASGNTSTGTGTLTAGGTSTLGVINATGLASLDGGIDVDGVFTVTDATGDISTTGTLNVDGLSTLGNVTIDASRTLDMGANAITNVADPTNPQDVATKAYVASVTGANSSFVIDGDLGTGTSTVSGGDTLVFAGTANEIETTVNSGTDTVTIGLPNNVTIGNNLTVTATTNTVAINATGLASLDAGIDVNNAAFTVGTDGTVLATGEASLDGGIAVGANYTVDGTGNILTSGTIGAGATTVTTLTASGIATFEGGITAETGAFTVADGSGNVSTTGSLTVSGAADFNGATTMKAVTFDAASVIDMGGNKVTNAGDPTAAQHLTTKSYVDQLVTSGTVWRDPVRDSSLVGYSAAAPGAPVTGETWVATGTATWGTLSVTANDVAYYTGTDWLAIEAPINVGDRFIIASGTSTLDTSFYNSGFRKNDLVQYTGGDVTLGTSWSMPDDVGYQIINFTVPKAGTDSTGFANDSTVYVLDVSTDANGTGETNVQVQVTGSTAQTITTLLGEINTDLDAIFGAGNVVATLEHLTSLGHIHITNVSDGNRVTIAEGTATGTGMLATLTNFDKIVGSTHNGTTVIVNDPESPNFGHTYMYSHEQSAWIEIAGPGSIEAGTNLSYTGSILNVSPQGAGSGLDADLLDSQQGTYYLDWTNTTNKPSPVITLGGDATGSVTLTALGSGTLTVAVVDNSHAHTVANVTGLQTALDGRVLTAGDTMDSAANLTFVGGGEVLGLPATPSATGAASKEYVDGLTGTNATFTIEDNSANSDVVAMGETLYFIGTGSEIETTVTNNVVTIGLPDNVTIAGILTGAGLANLNGGIAVDSTNFTVSGSTGAVATASTLTVGGLASLNAGIAVDGTKFTVADSTGNVVTEGTLGVTGLSTLTGGIAVNGTAFTVATSTGNVSTTGTLDVGGESHLAATTVTGTLTVIGLANIDNIEINGNDISAVLGIELSINDAENDIDFRVAGSTDSSLLLVDAGTNTVNVGTLTALTGVKFQVGGTDSTVLSKGTTAQRPSTGIAGMLRYNSTLAQYEFFDGSVWATFGTEFTVIASETFAGTGAQTAFTLATPQTTASCIVSINGVVQQPTAAYGVTSQTLTFTEAPLSGDVIEVRELTTTTSVNSITDGISTMTANNTALDVTGHILPTADITYDLGSAALKWRDLYLSGASIHLGDTVITATGTGPTAGLDIGILDGGTY